VGVIGADVSLSLLSQIVLDAKPSKNSYCTLLNGDGSFIEHPNGNQLLYQTAYTMSRHAGNPSLREAVEAMVSGETGYKAFTVNGNRFYVFYKPFTRAVVPGRSMEKLSWSAGMVYPEEDIFGDYNSLSYYVLFTAIIGLLTIFLLSRAIIHRQLKPLAMLTESAQRIAKGNYTEPIPVSKQRDEVGQLQNCFHQMQESLASNIGQLEQLQATLQERGESLRKAYKHAKKADRVKTIFLHYMTNQMTGPAENIENAVNTLCNGTATNRSEVVDDIVANGKTIAELLDNLINTSDEEMRKEVEHD
jgi:methyl-accepting chemotaxis protein